MSDFKEQLKQDLIDVWFSDLEEFWENVEVKIGTLTKKIKGIFDNDELIRKTAKKVYQETAQNLIKEKKLLICLCYELGKEPETNTKIIINKKTYTVIDVDNQAGVLFIQLELNTQGATNTSGRI